MVSMRVIELGSTDYSTLAELGQDVYWSFEPELKEEDPYWDVAFVARQVSDSEAAYLIGHVRAYCLFVEEHIVLSAAMERLCRSRQGRRYSEKNIRELLATRLRDYYAKSYGEKFSPDRLAVSPNFSGNVQLEGSVAMVLSGSFGDTMQQAAFWRSNIPVEQGQAIDFWLEYQKSGTVEIELVIRQFVQGSISTVQNVWKFSERDLRDVVTIENRKLQGPVFVSLNARGEGSLRIVALHDRYSRHGLGAFLPGGVRAVTKDREELFTYFDPGNLKPPLAVYFSGYKTMEGFEGYYMMRRFGCPFLLVSDARLEGGDFYLGDAAYEKLVVDAIEKARTWLGFAPDQMVFTGLSMGTFGALYYATKLPCRDIVVGKPLLSLGDVAANERLRRPGGFPTSLDVLEKECGSLDAAAQDRLNRRFWDRFDGTDWSGRSIYAAYMIEDDYDGRAYPDLLRGMRGRGAKVVGKGLHGRHNDDTHGIVVWFKGQLKRVLAQYGEERDGCAG